MKLFTKNGGVTADTAIRLGKYFEMSPQFWLGLQMDYDLDTPQDQMEKESKLQIQSYAS
jgi:antitoxin HigA-1